MTEFSRADIDYIESILNVIGVVERPKPPAHAPVAWPWRLDPNESQGWKPSYEGEQPPF